MFIAFIVVCCGIIGLAAFLISRAYHASADKLEKDAADRWKIQQWGEKVYDKWVDECRKANKLEKTIAELRKENVRLKKEIRTYRKKTNHNVPPPPHKMIVPRKD